MKLDYIDNVNNYGEDIVRLYDFKKEEALRFKEAIEETIIARNEELQLELLDFIEPRNCYLTLRLYDTDEGIQTLDNINFYCFLTLEAYKEMVKLIEPFCKKDTKAYQILYDIDTPIDFLFAPAGTW
jgi:hypothetical protein